MMNRAKSLVQEDRGFEINMILPFPVRAPFICTLRSTTFMKMCLHSSYASQTTRGGRVHAAGCQDCQLSNIMPRRIDSGIT